MTRHTPAAIGLSEQYVSPDDGVRAYAPSAPACPPCPGRAVDRVSDAEIARLISLALEDALVALAQYSPESFLHLRACERRRARRESLSSLPRIQAQDPTIRAEYWKEIVFENLAFDLGLGIVGAIRRYAGACGRQVAAQVRAPG